MRGAENYKDGAPVILHANNMKDAVRLARESAEPGDVVSLCPAATGFDMYKSFAVRGVRVSEGRSGIFGSKKKR